MPENKRKCKWFSICFITTPTPTLTQFPPHASSPFLLPQNTVADQLPQTTAALTTTALPLSKKTKKTTTTAAAAANIPTSRTSERHSRGSDNDDGVEAVVTKAGASNWKLETAVSERKAAPPKRAAGFFPTNESGESDAGGWDELHAKEAKATKGRKASVSKKISNNKKIVKKAKLDVGTVEEKWGEVKVSMVTQKPTKPKPKKLARPSDDEASPHQEDAGNASAESGQNSEPDSEDEYDEGDDQTATLLRGFESSDEEEDSSVAPLRKRDFRNLTVPGIKQKIASRITDVPPLTS